MSKAITKQPPDNWTTHQFYDGVTPFPDWKGAAYTITEAEQEAGDDRVRQLRAVVCEITGLPEMRRRVGFV